MTSTSISSLTETPDARPWISRSGWAWLIALGVLFVLVHHTFLERMLRIATNNFSGLNADWGHILAVPFIAGFFVFQHRDRLAAQPRRLCWWGLPLFFAGLFGYAMGIYPIRNDMAQGYSMILGLFGLVLLLFGPAVMRVLWFPILFLGFAVKISDRIWSQIAWELQQFAAQGATAALKCFAVFLNFDVADRGSTIDLTFVRGGQIVTEGLNVAEACSGLRMLMAFLALAVAMAFLFERAWWQRLIMVLMAVPIAVAVNITRVTVLGLLFLVNPELAHGSFHTFVGMLMLIPAAGLFLLLGWVLDRLIIRDEAAAATDAAPPPNETPTTPAPPEAARGVPAGLVVGVVTALVAGAAYGGMLLVEPPQVTLPMVPALLTGAAIKTAWTLLPPALVGAAVGALLLGLLLGRGWFRQFSRRTALVGGFVGGVLLTALVSQSAVIATTEWVLIKKPVPLRHTLILLPATMGTWELFHEDPPLSAEMLEALGTEQYISRIYRDTTWPENEPGSLARLHVAYYTGTADTVPHVPDRCFVAGGMVGLDKGSATLELEGDAYRPAPGEAEGFLYPAQLGSHTRIPSRTIEATTFTFADAKNTQRTENVLYFFVANGKFLASPDMVRLHGFDPRDRYSYYCKVEVQLLGVSDKQLAAERAEALLAHALPEIMACLPDWVEVTEGRWPRDGAAPAPGTRTALTD